VIWPFRTAPAPVVAPRAPPPAPKRDMAKFWRDVLGAISGNDRERPAHYKARSITSMPKPWPGVVPDRAELAMDEAGYGQLNSSINYGAAQEWNGYGFMGYAYLSELSQIPEFRRPSEILANEATREWVKLVSKSNADKTEIIKTLEDDMKTFMVRETFNQGFESDNFFGIGHIFIDTGASEDDLKNPLLLDPAKIAKGSLRALTMLDPYWTYPNRYNSVDPLSPNFFKPETWFVMGTEIHQSRILSFISRPVPDILKPAYMFGGVSLTQLLKPYVDNWLRTRQSVSDIMHNFSTPVLGIDMDMMTTAAGAQTLADRAQVYNIMRDNQGLFVRSFEKESFEIVTATLAGLDKLQAQAQEQMAGIAGIPLVKLFGITPSGLNASSDGEVRVYFDGVTGTQERIGTPALKLMLNVIQMNRFGVIDPDITFIWQPLWSLDDEKLANVRKVNAETDAVGVDHGWLSPAEVRQTIAAEEDSRYSSIDVDDMPPMPDPEAEGDPAAEGEADLSGGGEAGLGAALKPAPQDRGDRDRPAREPVGRDRSGRLGERERTGERSRPFDGARDAAFEENKHPRREDGKWGKGGGSATSLAANTYSPGIKASGLEWADEQKKTWRQAAPNSVDAILKYSAANQKALADVCNAVAVSANTEFADPGPKTKDSLARKVEDGRPAENITEAVRGGFNVNSPEEGDKIIRALAEHFEVADEGWQKNGAGYFDRKTMVRFSDGQVGEIQMWPPGMFEAKEGGGGHRLYEEQRTLPKDSMRRVELQEQMKALYGSVEAKLPAVWGSLFREVGSPD
jgi:phage-related protein (TIGR01555 family)